MRITGVSTWSVPVNARGGWLFVELLTSAGAIGLGEASHSGHDRGCVAVIERLVTSLLGRDPTDPREIRDRLLRAAVDRVRQTAVCALEQACWDLAGQAAGMPIHSLLSDGHPPRMDAIPLYANINRGNQQRTPESFAVRAVAAVAAGFTAVKLAPFDEVQPGMPAAQALAAAEHGIRRVEAVRQTIPAGVDLLVDCHWRFDVESAIILGRMLAERGAAWFEDPVRAPPTLPLKRIRAGQPLPVAAGELCFGMEPFRDLIEGEACDVVMPDVKHCGGIDFLCEIAHIAAAGGVSCSPHNPSGPVATYHSAHCLAAIPGGGHLEYQWDEVDWRAEVVDPPERIDRGMLAVPTGPGLGHRLNREHLLRHGCTL